MKNLGMTLILSTAEYRQLHQQKTNRSDRNLSLEAFETVYQKPESLAQSGFTLRTELLPGVYLDILNWHYRQEMILKVPVHPHPIQVLILASGFIDYQDIYPTFGGKRGYFSGSGLSPAYVEKYRRSQHILGINIEIEPERLIELFPNLLNDRENSRELLLNPDKPKISFFPEVTPSMLSIAKQIINVPFHGVVKKIYLQGKVLELLALQLEAIPTKGDRAKLSKLKPETVNRIYYAQEILDRTYHNPPSIIELAQTVGISDKPNGMASLRTLQRGFRQLFNTTVIGYITYLRIQQAEQLLRSGDRSVADVANLVGYSHLGHFAAAFKRQVGITPSECAIGKLA